MSEELAKWFALNREMIELLGRYNSERAHGLVHTRQWQAQMERAQRLYDDRLREEVTE